MHNLFTYSIFVSTYFNTLANKAADGVIQYKKFEYLDIQIDSFEQYYKCVHRKMLHFHTWLTCMDYLGIYIDIFDKEKYEKISDYDYAKNDSYKLLC